MVRKAVCSTPLSARRMPTELRSAEYAEMSAFSTGHHQLIDQAVRRLGTHGCNCPLDGKRTGPFPLRSKLVSPLATVCFWD